MEKQNIIPIIIPDDTYPYNCIYYKGNSNTKDSKKAVKKIIEDALKEKTSDENVEVAFLGKSFTSLDDEKQDELLEAVEEYIKEDKVDSIRIFARPDHITNGLLKKYRKYNVKTIELEVPSCLDYILSCTKFPYSYKTIKKAARKIRWKGFTLGCYMMIGLPDSTRIDEFNTAKAIVELKPKVTRIFPIYVMKGTKLEKDYKEEIYQPLTDKQGVEICKDIVRYFADKNIETIRIGFQDTKLSEEKGVVAGPFHPAFRQLVEIAMWYDAIVEKIKKLNVKVKEVEVTVNPIDVENVIGIKNENILKLKEVYDVDLIVKPNEEIKQGKSKIEIVKTYSDFVEN